MLLGSLDGTKAVLTRSIVLARKDKKKDRVEVGYENLASASTLAEQLTDADGKECRVLGWYHSHPHITVLPSHVDVRTQGYYQQLDRGFLGLIFSVFDKGNLEICAFQSRGKGGGVENCEWCRVEIPVVISCASSSRMDEINNISNISPPELPRLLESLVSLQLVLLNEDRFTFLNAVSGTLGSADCKLQIARATTVYQNALLKLVDAQLMPLLMALRSRLASLNYERDFLLKKSKKNLTEGVAQSVPNCNRVTRTLDALRAVESAVPEWTSALSALRAAREGILAKVSSNGNVISDGYHHVRVASNHETAPLSPWMMFVGDKAGSLMRILPEEVDSEVTCVLRFSAQPLVDVNVKLQFLEETYEPIGRLFREELHRALHLFPTIDNKI